MRNHLQVLVRELAFWYALPLAFLTYYVHVHHNPVSAALQHLYAISLIALFGIANKLFVSRFIANARVLPLLVAAMYAACLLVALTYYGLVTIGLNSWGRVITEEIIVSYASQAPLLSDALHISFEFVLFAFISSYFLAVCLCWWFFRPTWRGLAGFSRSSSPVPAFFLYVALVLFSGWHIRDFILGADGRSKEPIQLTLTLGKISNETRARPARQNTLLNRAEQKVKSEYQVGTAADRRNLVLIVVDALRPDHMGIYGYERETTPYLSRLAKEGRVTVVKNVRAACGESVCGLSSIASARFAHQLPDTPFTLQQVLKLHGYEVQMILGGDHTNFYNLKFLYDGVDHFYDGSMAKGRYVNDDSLVLEKVKTLAQWSGRPVMFQFHLMSSHGLGKRLPEFEAYKPYRSYAGNTAGSPSVEYTNHYDNGVLQTDSMVRELLGSLEEKNYLRNALIVITADHGESLGEHQLFAHANSVREEVLRLPLILANFGDRSEFSRTGGRMISQIDIAPTVLHEMRIPAPVSWVGRPIQRPRDAEESRPFSYFQFGGDIGLYDHRDSGRDWKYWRNVHRNEEFAFEVRGDPGELSNQIRNVPIELKNEWRQLARASRIGSAISPSP